MKARPLYPTGGARPRGKALAAFAQRQQQWLAWRNTQLTPRWQAMAPRERLGLLLALAALGLLLVWQVAVAPALTTLRTAPPAKAALQVQLARMQGLAAEAQRLRQQPPLPAAQAQEALRAATARLGPAARLSLQGDRATVSFTSVEGAAFLSWLADVRSAARAKPVEAQLSRVGTGYTGSLTLVLASGG